MGLNGMLSDTTIFVPMLVCAMFALLVCAMFVYSRNKKKDDTEVAEINASLKAYFIIDKTELLAKKIRSEKAALEKKATEKAAREKAAWEKANPKEAFDTANIAAAFSKATASFRGGGVMGRHDYWDQHNLYKQTAYLMFREDTTKTVRRKVWFLKNLEHHRSELRLDNSASIEEVEMARRENHKQCRNEIAAKKVAKKAAKKAAKNESQTV